MKHGNLLRDILLRSLSSSWFYKVKEKPDGSFDRCKAHLVANGFRQREGLDYEETFALVIKLISIRIVIALAVTNGWGLRQLDISNAFLHGFLEEEVFMRQPQGFVDAAKPSHVCHLIKSIYRLKHLSIGTSHFRGHLKSKHPTELRNHVSQFFLVSYKSTKELKKFKFSQSKSRDALARMIMLVG